MQHRRKKNCQHALGILAVLCKSACIGINLPGVAYGLI